ncbi:putative antar domain protein [Mycobacterium xenopi 4042]|uniref:Putative antar domain protein n=1 Tax=Mycobacterium xenopi 4042 TaxID=1299334 RepID=X8E8V3_MYCXE|nr:putative antar domain protein [Mycobacterium xenopi 4042]
MGSGASSSAAAPDPATVFAALAEIIYQGSDPSDVYAAICVAATLIVPGCDHASLLLRRDGGYVTVGASDRIAQQIDDLELSVGDGPCLDAIEEETPQIEPDLTTPSQWPSLRRGSSRRHRCAVRWGFGSWSIAAKPVRSTCSATP